jgi:hypothetical protein
MDASENSQQQVSAFPQRAHPWLLSLSVLLVTLIEIVPVEIDILYDHYLNRNYPSILAFKLLFVSVILLPSLVFRHLNHMSRMALCYYGRFQFTIVVVSLWLLADLFIIVRSLNS